MARAALLSWRARAAIAFAAGCALTHCSLWVSSEPEQIGCAEEGKLGEPACNTGYVCAHQTCVACSREETCGDGIDNDCNGFVDDGCSHVSEGGGNSHGGFPFAGSGGAAKTAGSAGSR